MTLKQFYERLIEGLYEKSYTIDVNVIKSDLAHKNKEKRKHKNFICSGWEFKPYLHPKDSFKAY